MRQRMCLCHFVADLVKANWTWRRNRVRTSVTPFHLRTNEDLLCVFPFLSFHMKSGTYWALHRGRDIFFWNMASMICIIILIIAGLTFIEHLKSSQCKIHICFVAFLRAWRGNCSLHSTAIKSRSAWNRCYVTQKQRSALQKKKKFFP